MIDGKKTIVIIFKPSVSMIPRDLETKKQSHARRLSVEDYFGKSIMNSLNFINIRSRSAKETELA